MAFLTHLRRGLASMRKMSCGQIVGMTICLLLVIIAGSGQLILVNLWVHSFPTETKFATANHSAVGHGDALIANNVTGFREKGEAVFSGSSSSSSEFDSSSFYSAPATNVEHKAPIKINVPFTVMTFIVVPNAIFFSVGFTIWYLIKRPPCKFILGLRAQALAFGVGMGNSIFNIVFTSALRFTPEVVQAFLLSSAILWTFLFVKIVFREKRSYNSPLIWLSFALSLGGILLGSAYNFSGGAKLSTSAWGWTALFAFIQLPVSLAAVLQTMFMRRFTVDTDLDKLPAGAVSDKLYTPLMSETSFGDINQQHFSQRASDADDFSMGAAGIGGEALGTDADTAKFASLWLSALWEVPILAAMLPLGALPWFGSSPTMEALDETLWEGYKCSFGLVPHTPNTYEPWVYGLLYNIFYGIKNIGGTFLAYYSPAMSSLVGQLSSPLTALALLVAPHLNVNGGGVKMVSVPMTIGAIVLLVASSILYTAWEESTRHNDAETVASMREIESNNPNPLQEGESFGQDAYA